MVPGLGTGNGMVASTIAGVQPDRSRLTASPGPTTNPSGPAGVPCNPPRRSTFSVFFGSAPAQDPRQRPAHPEKVELGARFCEGVGGFLSSSRPALQYLANAETCWGADFSNNGNWDCRLRWWSKDDSSVDVRSNGRAPITPRNGSTLPGSRIGLHRDAV